MIKYVEVEKLKHIEGFSKVRVDTLRKKIVSEKMWNQPLKVEKNHYLVLDGQHRLEVAKLLNLKRIPCQLFDYNDVKLWSLRKNHPVSRELVIENSLSGNIYPYKTVKHSFPNIVTDFYIPLNELYEMS